MRYGKNCERAVTDFLRGGAITGSLIKKTVIGIGRGGPVPGSTGVRTAALIESIHKGNDDPPGERRFSRREHTRNPRAGHPGREEFKDRFSYLVH